MEKTVIIEFPIEAKPIDDSINLVGYRDENATDAAINCELSQCAILECGSKGLNLRKEHYSMWQKVHSEFDSKSIKLRL
tara:strand:- start:125 stop:361 length:237 start_codon:yes stop_codon:yes gene_type:complete